MKKLNLFALGLVTLGLASCAGETTEETDNSDAPVETVEYTYEQKGSILKWAGTYMKNGEFDHDHKGIVNISSGSVMVAEGVITSGSFEIDLNSIDEPEAPMGEESRAKLITHLKSGDYFDVERYPTATVKLEECTPNSLKGTLMLRGVELPFESPAEVAIMEDGNMVQIMGELDIDFTKFSMLGIGKEGDPEYVSPMVKVGYSINMRKKA